MSLRKVKIESGWVEGIGAMIPTTTIFKSIPYAAPPVGENRWRAPQAVEPWEGVYQANKFRAIPPLKKLQPGDVPYDEFYGFGATEVMDEDCLHLSIWTPAQSADEKLPVLLHLHGGAFIEGYSYAVTFLGDAFARQGIVYVSVEYRLGALGFMAHPELTSEASYHASGNYGLLDQVAALKWVKRNIAAFGGDPDNITINGQSAGAISCEYLKYSPLVQGDISKAIFQSGGSFTNKKDMMFFGWQHKNDTLKYGETLGEKFLDLLGVETIEEARKVPWKTILKTQIDHPELAFWPVIDGYHIPRHIDDTIRSCVCEDIPVIIGSTLDEGIALAEDLNMTPEEYETTVKKVFGSFGQKYLEYNGFYEEPSYIMNGSFAWEEFTAGTIAWCEESIRRKNKQPVYHYLFTRDVPGSMGGAGHSMDLWYSFKALQYSSHPVELIDHAIAEAMNTYFCNFIKTGNPNGENLPEWKTYTITTRNAMEFGEHIGMIPNYSTPRVQMLVDYIMNENEE